MEDYLHPGGKREDCTSDVFLFGDWVQICFFRTSSGIIWIRLLVLLLAEQTIQKLFVFWDFLILKFYFRITKLKILFNAIFFQRKILKIKGHDGTFLSSFHSIEPFKSAPTATANKTAMAEKLCLQWNDFTESVKTAFGNLKEDTDFTDVTLFCEDGNQICAHKVVLAASSPTLQKMLKRSEHPQPMIYIHARFEVRSSFCYDWLPL